MPAFTRHPDGARVATALDRGVVHDLLRVDRLLKRRRWREKGVPIEPAYLLLSSRQGGYARYGFQLDGEKKPGVAYVDVHRSWPLSGDFGAVDQIFPHELAHAMLRQAGIERPAGGANQVHAIAVRTDRFTAFDEGFAEHLQVIAVDHPGAVPETRALAGASARDGAARRHLDAYRRELEARLAVATPMRIGFPLWYSGDERVLRYFAVKRNEFSREPALPERLLTSSDRYRAYLLENMLPGDAGGAPRPAARLVACEGAMSSLFHRWASDAALQHHSREAAFYARYGTSAAEVPPLENLYLKLLDAVEARRPTSVPQLIDAYAEVFPDEAGLLDSVVKGLFPGGLSNLPNEIWLANDAFATGTTVFDQFRGAPRVHTFDLNAASLVDLTSIPEVTPELARAIAGAGPYASVDDLSRAPGVPLIVRLHVAAMAKAAHGLRAAVDDEQIPMRLIFQPYVERLAIVLLVSAIGGAWAYRRVRQAGGPAPSQLRATVSGLGAAVVGVAAGLLFRGHGLGALSAVVLLFGVPAALWALSRSRQLRPAALALAAWLAAAVPAALLTTPWL